MAPVTAAPRSRSVPPSLVAVEHHGEAVAGVDGEQGHFLAG